MIFSEKIRELKEFINKQDENQVSERGKGSLLTYIDCWERDTRVELGLPSSSESTIGISFDEHIELQRLPQWGVILPGFYENTKVGLKIEVLRQNQQDGSIVFNTYCGDEIGNLEGMSFGMFNKLFEKTIPTF